jgi:hypothetical protein
MMVKNKTDQWHLKGIVDVDKNGVSHLHSMDDHDSFFDSEFWCRVTCSAMIIENVWDRAYIFPPGCTSLNDVSVIQVERGINGKPVFTGESMTCKETA